MSRPTLWRVRVSRRIETFVDVLAFDGAEAEWQAAKMPGVISVFGKSAIPADEADPPLRQMTVQDDG